MAPTIVRPQKKQTVPGAQPSNEWCPTYYNYSFCLSVGSCLIRSLISSKENFQKKFIKTKKTKNFLLLEQ